MEINFGASAPYTVGVEEEFQLVHPETLELSPVIDAVLAAREASGLPKGSVSSELLASFLEVRSPVFGGAAELAEELPKLRRGARELVEGCGARLASAGTHPFSDSTAQPVTGKERYRDVEEEMGWTARMQAIFGLHVHVAVPDAARAIRAVAALSRYVPLFIALSANSPFWAGSDTNLASARVKLFGLVPRSGLPPAFRQWKDFEGYVGALVAAGSISDYSRCWWDVRPHPGLGTVELRSADAQTDAGRTASLAALAQCLVATAEEHQPEDPLLTAENKWQATRYGLDGRFYDYAAGEGTTIREASMDLAEKLRPASRDLGCETQLEGVAEIAAGNTGSDIQRAVFEETGSLRAVVEHLVVNTTEGEI